MTADDILCAPIHEDKPSGLDWERPITATDIERMRAGDDWSGWKFHPLYQPPPVIPALYMAMAQTFLQRKLYRAGDLIQYDGPPNVAMKPLNEPAIRAYDKVNHLFQ